MAVVADIHIGRNHGRAWTCPALPAALRAIRAERPDLLIFAGDFAFKEWTPVDLAHIASLFEAGSRVAVLGNHDFARGDTQAAQLADALEDCGITVLRNQAHMLRFSNQPVWVAGLDDAPSGHDDVDLLLSRLPEGASPAILLSHGPDAVREAARTGRFMLAVAGHTHGGQVAIPGLRSFILRRFAHSEFDRGLYRLGGMPLVVTKGLGMVGYPVRFRARPEVVFLKLHSSQID